MLLAEEEAKKKWCPELHTRVPVKDTLCCASMCPAWRWIKEKEDKTETRVMTNTTTGHRKPITETKSVEILDKRRRGYCGIAGKPEGETQ